MAMGNNMALVWMAEENKIHIKQGFQLRQELSTSKIRTRYIDI